MDKIFSEGIYKKFSNRVILNMSRVSHVLLNVRQTSDIMYQIIMTGYAERAYPTDNEYDR